MVRFFMFILAVLAIGIGAGVLGWGIASTATGDPIRSPIDYLNIGFAITTPSEAIGWGVGGVAAGLTALVIGLASGPKRPNQRG